MIFVGIDLAWGSNARTGLCAVTDGQVIDSALVRTDDEIVAWVRPHVEGPCVVGIDAPLVVANPTGRRGCEQVIARWMGPYEAGPHSSNLANAAFTNGTRGARLASLLGLDIDPSFPPGADVRSAIEVYPHPALVVLFDLPKSLKYKAKSGRSVADRRAQFDELRTCLERLRAATPPLAVDDLNPRWSGLWRTVDDAATQAALDRAEDEIDAYICAYTALHHWTHGPPRSQVIGTLAEGYIVTPLARADGSVDQARETALAAASSG